MIKPRLFLCNGATISDNSDRQIIELRTNGSNPNVNIRLENVTDKFLQHLSPRLTDLIEIASYVYAADCATSRGTAWISDKESWERDFQWHCGTCSQCIDRRIAIFAAGQENYDLDTDYVSDVFVGQRKDGYEKNIAVNYARHACELARMDDQEIASKFNRDITRAIRNFSKKSEAGQEIIRMHKRHGESVANVLQKQIEQHSNSLLQGLIEKSSMIAMIAGQQHLCSSWQNYTEKIIELLKNGIPTACKTHKPKDEPHRQSCRVCYAVEGRTLQI